MSDSNVTNTDPVSGGSGNGSPVSGEVRNPVYCILLTIITCGIYSFYWDWVTKDQINKLANKEVVGSGLIILSWLCFPIKLYLWYKWDMSLQDIAQQYNARYTSNFILWIILTIFAGVGWFVMLFQVQDTLNKIYGGE